MNPEIPKEVRMALHRVAHLFDEPLKAYRLLIRNVRFDKPCRGWLIDGLPVADFLVDHQEMRAKRERHAGKHPLSILVSAFDHDPVRTGTPSKRCPSLTHYDRRRDPGHGNASIYNPKTGR